MRKKIIVCLAVLLVTASFAAVAQTWQTPSSLLTEFASGQPPGAITPAQQQNLIVSTNLNYTFDTPQRPSVEGNASGGRVGAILNIPVPVGAIVINPTQNINTVVNANPAGSTFYLSAGVYRNAQVSMLAGDTLIGAVGAVLNGANLLTSWSGSAGAYVTTAPQGTGFASDTATCETGYPGCNYALDVYYDGKPLLWVSAAPTATGQFYYNSSAGTITIYDNPTGHTVETSVTSYAFPNSASNVTLKNLVITKYATHYQEGAIGAYSPQPSITGWIMDHLEVSLNHAYGVRPTFNGSTLSNSWLHDNGEMGVGGGSNTGFYISGNVITGNEMAYNNYAGYQCATECGGLKFGQVTNVDIIYNNSHNNIAYQNGDGPPGLWCDVDCMNVNISYNKTHDNGGGGIQLEEGCYSIINNNVLYNDGFNSAGCPGSCGSWGGEIMIPASNHVTIAYNRMGGYGGILGPQQLRTDVGINCGNPHVISAIYAHDNNITVNGTGATTSGVIGFWCDPGNSPQYCPGGANNIFPGLVGSFVNNTYALANSTTGTVFHWSGSGTSFSAWQGFGQDTTSNSWVGLTPYAPNWP